MDMKKVKIDGDIIIPDVKWCATRKDLRNGLLGREALSVDGGAMLVMPRLRSGLKGFWTSIHMVGMKFPLTVVWINKDRIVVHVAKAEIGRYYASPKRAWYVLEIHESLFGSISVGMEVSWDE